MTLGVLLVAISLVLVDLAPKVQPGPAMDSAVWAQFVVAFVTGLTTGGLSCLAVQGSLLASSLAYQIEQDYIDHAALSKKEKRKTDLRSSAALPIFLFLVAKLAVYTLFGALLGWLGSYLTLSPTTRALLMIAIGMFMIGNALRMFNVHPIFRYFSIEPPKFITRYIRRTAKGTDIFTPVFLGALTVFIPCGITQAMMATSLATGSVVMGAALMFAFTLGTSPVFFMVAYLATELGAQLEKFFMRFVAVVVLILGLYTLNGGLNLIGSPLSFQNMTHTLYEPRNETATAPQTSRPSASEGELVLEVKNNGYFPSTLKAPAGEDLKLSLVTNGTFSCALSFIIPALEFYQMLPPVGTVQVDIPAQEKGSTLFFTCSMGMYTG